MLVTMATGTGKTLMAVGTLATRSWSQSAANPAEDARSGGPPATGAGHHPNQFRGA
jgi:hypothetical protein